VYCDRVLHHQTTEEEERRCGMLITRPVGDIFVYRVPDAPMDVWVKVLRVRKNNYCKGCMFLGKRSPYCENWDSKLVGYCSAEIRTDGNDVIFKQIGTYKPQEGVEYGD